MLRRSTLAGFPATMQLSGTSSNTTAPAPTITWLPMLTPGRIVDPPPIKLLLPIVIALSASPSPFVKSRLLNATRDCEPMRIPASAEGRSVAERDTFAEGWISTLRVVISHRRRKSSTSTRSARSLFKERIGGTVCDMAKPCCSPEWKTVSAG